jgi:hypothetical protein
MNLLFRTGIYLWDASVFAFIIQLAVYEIFSPKRHCPTLSQTGKLRFRKVGLIIFFFLQR